MTPLIELTYTAGDGWPLFAHATAPATALSVASTPVLVLMHGGGPDHRSLVPLAARLGGEAVVVLPDVRGYGRSRCADPSLHTWAQYAADVVSLLDHLRVSRAIVGGAGLGATVALRTAVEHPIRVAGLVLISVEDIEDDAAKAAEVMFIDAFAERVRHGGVEAGWAPLLDDLSPVIGAMVRESMADADPASLVAAAAIGRDRAFRRVDDLLSIDVPTLVFAGGDWRHPAVLANTLADQLPHGRLGHASMSNDLRSADDFARAFAPEILDFLRSVRPH